MRATVACSMCSMYGYREKLFTTFHDWLLADFYTCNLHLSILQIVLGHFEILRKTPSIRHRDSKLCITCASDCQVPFCNSLAGGCWASYFSKPYRGCWLQGWVCFVALVAAGVLGMLKARWASSPLTWNIYFFSWVSHRVWSCALQSWWMCTAVSLISA